MKTLTIISHTEHYKLSNGTIVGLASTVTEINHLLKVFDQINHVAMLHSTSAPASTLPYLSDRVKLIPLKAVGGQRFVDKFSVIWQAPKVINVVKKALKQSDCFQFRAPTGIGVYVIPYLFFFSAKTGWFKYAGNWKQSNAPLAYRFQKWMLEKQNRHVTINGSWANQPSQCLTFENPCLSKEDIEKGHRVAKNKTFSNNLINFCFVGRLEEAKGIDLLINAFKSLNEKDSSKVGTIHVVGDGKRMEVYKNDTKDSKLNFHFHGFLSRDMVHEIYIKSHAIVLPSSSEGFPKVIAEALNFGCLPVVSNVSGISNYIKDGQNGFLLDDISVEEIAVKLQCILSLSAQDYLEMLNCNREQIEKFTFDFYNSRVQNELIK
ncbi:glycosyltransferase [Psychroserpens ponticola]|uniref:Glycosyltransferase n=1 Tax=Psychroserpens ponticola TaxID=2932268 RepID=A0ABY7RZH2_9FLAO|nr:glycosyltransferase [Psychroserpens ponticola]WCO02543.1 glycosyltransferase [Psychroserpens ponticola]